MKTARFLLACAAASVLAACGSDTITSPATTTPARPHADIAPGDSGESQSSTGCIKIIVINADGTTSEQCLYEGSGMIGSGG